MKDPMTHEQAQEFFSDLFGGIHHVPEIKPAGFGWQISTAKDMSTYDNNFLTRLVLKSHAECVRSEIQGSNFGKLRIMIWKRESRDGKIYDRHPTIEQAIESYSGKKVVKE